MGGLLSSPVQPTRPALLLISWPQGLPGTDVCSPDCQNGKASLMAQWQRTHLPMQKTWVRSLGGKIPWRRKWQPTPVFLPGESHGQRSLVGCSPWGSGESDMTEQLSNNRKEKGIAGQPHFTCPHTQPCRRWDSAPRRSSPQMGSPDPHPVGSRPLLPPQGLPERAHSHTFLWTMRSHLWSAPHSPHRN